MKRPPHVSRNDPDPETGVVYPFSAIRYSFMFRCPAACGRQRPGSGTIGDGALRKALNSDDTQ